MKLLQTLLDDYLVARRMLGAKLEESERLLHQFVEFLEEYNVEHITMERALEWATLPRDASLPTEPAASRKSATLRHTPVPLTPSTKCPPAAFYRTVEAGVTPTSTETKRSSS